MASTITIPNTNLGGCGSQLAVDLLRNTCTQAAADVNALQASVQKGVATLVLGTVTVDTTVTITASSVILVTMKTPAGVLTLTTGYIARGSARTAGAPGVASFTIEAIVAAGSINVADLSVVDWAIFN